MWPVKRSANQTASTPTTATKAKRSSHDLALDQVKCR
jgi:hypothetical protein